jgi:phosphotransferase system  glucose/maltose/N-acetylglucosamine-specific IIC component
MMNGHLSIKVVGLSLSALFAVTYLVAVAYCIVAAALGPSSGMMTSSSMMGNAMQAMLPGFGWQVAGFVIGLVLTIIYAFYIAVIFVPVYNYLQRRESQATTEPTRRTEPQPAYR